MSIIAVDVIIKTAIEAAFADLRKNNWILAEIFSGLAIDPLASVDYGMKEVERAVEWFMGNNIDVYLTNRVDTPRFPSVTVVQLSSREMQERSSLSDEGSIEDITPGPITKQVQMQYPTFTPKAYDQSTGIVTFPSTMNTSAMLVGQFLVSKRTGKAYVIKSVLSASKFQISAKVNDDFTNSYIAPPTDLWNLEKELTFLEESFAIGMHTQSDINEAIWMRQLMQYIFLRYKEAFLESRGFELSTFNLGAIDKNPHFSNEMVWTCMMNVSGQVEANFIKFASPKIQGIKGKISIVDGPKTPKQYQEQVQGQSWDMENDRNPPDTDDE